MGFLSRFFRASLDKLCSSLRLLLQAIEKRPIHLLVSKVILDTLPERAYTGVHSHPYPLFYFRCGATHEPRSS